ncbi:uncharacterized protein BJ171DRAFT_594922 [Polychytrium aggregatum]|uniref:uncharacterized protein n=1 Tax=Polychytrium aggregatum TaxID=110093 RepID=UPI0022FEF1D6|nr:uncharacterized protein BJ171DRAFT_594922 [Polychytrium aggregatum]KAI9209911.1 hypothetical protein BJ171DRAFT_594922 [Polychytrium aggregatum]
MASEFEEIFGFLRDSRPEVRLLASQHVVGFTGTNQHFDIFKKDDGAAVKTLMELTHDTPEISHEALRALINLSADTDILNVLNSDGFIYHVILQILLPKSLLADLYCMLLNNLSKYTPITLKLVPEDNYNNPVAKSTDDNSDAPKKRTHQLDNLLEVFVRGESKKFNPDAEYHFLAGVFANIASTRVGMVYFQGRSNVDQQLRLSKITAYTEHPNIIRRGGCVSTVKNCCFDVKYHAELLRNEELNLLVYILLPLMGPEDYDEDDYEGMPAELQLLEPTKTRETDANLRQMLVEALLLLTNTRNGRDYLRAKKAYPILRNLHLIEKNEAVRDRIERFVDVVMADEPKDNKIEEIDDDSSDEEEATHFEAII